MSYKCFKCGTYLVHSYDTCTNCASIAAAERQTDKITSAIKEANAASQQQAQALLAVLAGVAHAQAAAAKEQAAAAQLQIQLENEKSTLNEAAYNAGFGLSFISKNPEAFIGSLNDVGEITALSYTNPYVLDRLKNAFNEGVWSRLRSELGSPLRIAGAEEYFIGEAYKAGSLGEANVTLQLKEKKPDQVFVNWLIDCKISTKKYQCQISPYLYDDSTGQFQLNSDSYDPPFKSDSVRLGYVRGICAYIEKQNLPEVVAARISQRKREVGWKFGVLALGVLLCLALGSLGYLFWQSGHWVRAGVSVLFALVSLVKLGDGRYLIAGMALAGISYANYINFRF